MANKPYHGPANQARYLSLYKRNQIATETQIGDRTTTTSNTTTPTIDYRPEVEVFDEKNPSDPIPKHPPANTLLAETLTALFFAETLAGFQEQRMLMQEHKTLFH